MAQPSVLIAPILSEKALQEKEKNARVCFRVIIHADKKMISQAVAKRYGVEVVEVHTCVMPAKPKRRGSNFFNRPKWKKAVVKLKDASKIDLLAL